MKATEENASRNANVTGRMRTAGENVMSAGKNSILPKAMETGMMAAGTTATGMANGGEDYRTLA